MSNEQQWAMSIEQQQKVDSLPKSLFVPCNLVQITYIFKDVAQTLTMGTFKQNWSGFCHCKLHKISTHTHTSDVEIIST